jgi:signal transduction histidine kinase
VLQYQKYAYVNSMGAIVAHQLRQPLSVLSMLLPKIQKENIELVVCPTILDDVGECIMQAKKASSIITNFTKYAKEPFSESIGQVSVKKTGKSVISLLSSKAKQHNIDIQFEPSDDLQDIRISSTALEQIFFILIQNAIEAAGNSKKHKINISAESNGEFIELKFADDCGGIPEEDIDMIFEPFFSTKEQGKGTGLGLEIIQRILMNYGGKIEVDSIFGKGSTFNVAVPVNTDII